MKIAVFGDVHGNHTALKAALADIEAWGPDFVIATGDIINRGPSSRPCLDLVLAGKETQGWRTILGNHEEYVMHQATPEASRSGPEYDSFFQSFWTYEQIGRDIEPLFSWEDQVEMTAPNGDLVRVSHGSVLGNNIGIYPEQDDAAMVACAGDPPPALFCAGHTHAAFVRRIDETLYVNAGSVGIPFDRDWRAGYARLTHGGGGWEAEIVRLAYDREATLAEYQDSGFLQDAGPIAWLVLAEYLFSRSQLYAWHRDYYEGVARGEIDLDAAVIEQLEMQGIWPQVKAYLP